MALYEIHLTIEKTDQVEHFQNICQALGLKPLLLNLHFYANKLTGGTKKDVPNMMTSSVFYGKYYDDVAAFSDTLAYKLNSCGFRVIRTKIETPFDSSLDEDRPIPVYYEAHQKLTLADDVEDTLWFPIKNGIHENLKIYKEREVHPQPFKLYIPHLSSNSLNSDNGTRSRMVTWRTGLSNTDKTKIGLNKWPNNLELSIAEFAKFVNYAFGNSVHMGKIIRENVIFDSNKAVEQEWAPIN